MTFGTIQPYLFGPISPARVNEVRPGLLNFSLSKKEETSSSRSLVVADFCADGASCPRATATCKERVKVVVGRGARVVSDLESSDRERRRAESACARQTNRGGQEGNNAKNPNPPINRGARRPESDAACTHRIYLRPPEKKKMLNLGFGSGQRRMHQCLHFFIKPWTKIIIFTTHAFQTACFIRKLSV